MQLLTINLAEFLCELLFFDYLADRACSEDYLMTIMSFEINTDLTKTSCHPMMVSSLSKIISFVSFYIIH